MQKYNLFYNEAELSVIIYDKNQLKDLHSKQKIIFEENPDLNIRMQLFLEKHISFALYCQEINIEKVFYYLKSYFRFVQAAGGIVTNHKNEILVIKRFGYYDFPKGHIEKDEDAAIAAMREVKEETNVGNLIITQKLGTTYHIFSDKNGFILKETQWFKIEASATNTLKPQTEEGIEKVWWMTMDDLKKMKSNFYLSIQQLINKILI